MRIDTQADVEKYYEGRGISRATLNRFGVESGPDGRSIRVREGAGGSVFRCFGNDGVRWKASGKRECTVVCSGADVKAVYVVEGVHDLMSLLECGVKDAVAIPSAAMVKALPDVIRASWKAPCEIRLLLDRDDAGNKATQAIIERSLFFSPFALSDVRSAILGQCKDVNDALVRDRVGLAQRLGLGSVPDAAMVLPSGADEPPPWPDEPPPWLDVDASAQEPSALAGDEATSSYDIGRVIVEGASELRDLGIRKPLKFGIELLDQTIDGLPVGLTVLGAGSGAGKTTLALQLAAAAAQSGHLVLFYSFEMGRGELLGKLLAQRTRRDLRSIYELAASGALESDLKEVEKNFPSLVVIVPKDEPMSASAIRDDAAMRIANNKSDKPALIIIDYLQLIDNQNQKQSERLSIDHSITTIRRAARNLGAHVLLISSLNRGAYSSPVSMSSFKESGGIEYGSDLLLGMHLSVLDNTDEKDIPKEKVKEAMDASVREVTLNVLKNRSGSIKNSGCALFFESRFGVFSSKAPASEVSKTTNVLLSAPPF